MRDDERSSIELDAGEQRLFAELPREASLEVGETDRMVRRLRGDGFLQPRRNGWMVAAAAAAAVVCFAAGIGVGQHVARRGSLEDMLARTDLSAADRVLLLQRAGSAYVRAAQSYADATSRIDSGAVEVASKVLLGAAHAVARNSMDAGLSARLATALQPSVVAPVSAVHKPVIWY